MLVADCKAVKSPIEAVGLERIRKRKLVQDFWKALMTAEFESTSAVAQLDHSPAKLVRHCLSAC